MPRPREYPDLAELLPSWVRALKAERKSPKTIRSYSEGVRQFLAWCEREGQPAVLDRSTVNAFVADLLEAGPEGATARARQLAVRRFSRWLADEGEVERDELVGLSPPALDQKIVPRLTDEQCQELIRACQGRRFRDRRDEAIIRLMLESGVRAGEVVSMTVANTDLDRGRALIRRGKGGKDRVVPFGPRTALAIDRYLRMRKGHKLADTPRLWLGERSSGFTYDALYATLKRRGKAAGIENFHPHMTRHTAAQRWLAAGGSEGGLMAVAGWARREMLDRYTRATAAERAAEEASRLGLDEWD